MNVPVAIGQNDEDFRQESKETMNSVRIEKKASMDSEADAIQNFGAVMNNDHQAIQQMLQQKDMVLNNRVANHHHRQSTIEQALSPQQMNEQDEMIRRLKRTKQTS